MFLIFTGPQLIYNVVLISTVQQSESAIHQYTSFSLMSTTLSLCLKPFKIQSSVLTDFQSLNIERWQGQCIHISRWCRWWFLGSEPRFNLRILLNTVFQKATMCVGAQSCLNLCNPINCSPPDSSVRGIFQARILEWVTISFSRGCSWPRDRSYVSWGSCIAGDSSSLSQLPSNMYMTESNKKSNSTKKAHKDI